MTVHNFYDPCRERSFGTSPPGQMFDNTDPAFSVTGPWFTWTSNGEAWGSDHRAIMQNSVVPESDIIDNVDVEAPTASESIVAACPGGR